MTTKYAASYARKSTNDPLGIEAQHFINAKCAEGDGYVIPNSPDFRLSDDDVSGRTTQRDGFSRLLALVESGAAPFDLLYIKDATRWGRWLDVRNLDYYAVHFEKHGVRLRFTTEGPPIDYEHGDRREINARHLNRAMKSIASSDELDQLQRRVRGGMRSRVLMGLYPGAQAPYGTDRWLVSKTTGAEVQLVPPGSMIRMQDGAYRLKPSVDGSAAIVQEIFSLSDAGTSHRGIAKILNERGVPCPAARRGTEDSCWSGNGVKKILGNTTYAGYIIWGASYRDGSAIPIEDADLEETLVPVVADGVLVPPIISRDMFDRVQAKLAGSRETWAGRRRQSPDLLLSGLLVCAKCKQPLNGANSSGASHQRYYRHERRTELLKNCTVTRAYYPADELEAAVDEAVRRWLDNGQLAGLVEAELERLLAAEERVDHSHELALLRAKERDLEAAGKNAALQIAQAKSACEVEMFKHALEKLTADLMQCREGVRLLTQTATRLGAAQARFESRKGSWSKPLDLYESGSIPERRGFLQQVLKRVEFDGDTGALTLVLWA